MNTENREKVLVTGSTGFIGRHLVDEFIKRGYDVLCLIRKNTNVSVLNNSKVTLVPADYSDINSLEKALTGIDYLIHNGAVISSLNKKYQFEANVSSTRNLMKACIKVNPNIKKIVFVSSISASGPSINKRPVKESDECIPTSNYGESKYLAEQEVKKYFRVLPVIILRPTNILGIHQKQIKDIIKLGKKRVVPILGNGDKQTTICFIEDLVKAFVLAIENGEKRGEIYFVAGEEVYSWKELTSEILGVMGIKYYLKVPYPFLIVFGFISEIISYISSKPPLISRKRVKGVYKNYWIQDTGKIRRELGFKNEIEFKAGIEKIVSWYMKDKN